MLHVKKISTCSKKHEPNDKSEQLHASSLMCIVRQCQKDRSFIMISFANTDHFPQYCLHFIQFTIARYLLVLYAHLLLRENLGCLSVFLFLAISLEMLSKVCRRFPKFLCKPSPFTERSEFASKNLAICPEKFINNSLWSAKIFYKDYIVYTAQLVR